MKLVVIALCVVVAVVAEDDVNILDKVDVQEILDNKRLMKAHGECMVDKGPCTADAKKLKDTIPEIISTKCGKCTATHKQNGKLLAEAMKANFPDLHSEILNKYDLTEEELIALYS